jgi:hypothetical protein
MDIGMDMLYRWSAQHQKPRQTQALFGKLTASAQIRLSQLPEPGAFQQ